MIKFNSIKVRNFKSFGNKDTTMPLDDTGTTLILGNNEDIGEKGNSRNGVGKSSILSAIVYALYNKDLDKLKPDELINLRNGKNMRVELDFTVKDEPFKIIRGRKPNILEFYHGDTSLTRDSMKNTDQEILNVIGIDCDVFLSVFFLNPFKETFMSMSPASQRNFMESVLSLDTLAKRADSLKALKKELSVDLKLAQKDLDNAVLLREREEAQRKSLIAKADDFERKRNEAIEELTLAKEECQDIDFDGLIKRAEEIKPDDSLERMNALIEKQNQLSRERDAIIRRIEMINTQLEKAAMWEKEHESKLSSLEEQLASMPSIADVELRDSIDMQVLAYENKLLGIQDEMRKTRETEIPSLERKQSELEEEFSSLEAGTCPYCSQRHTNDDRMSAIADEFDDIASRMTKLEALQKQREESFMKTTKELEGLKEQKPDIDKSITVRDVETLERRIVEAQQMENPHSGTGDVDDADKDRIDDIIKDTTKLDEMIASLKADNAVYEKTQQAIKKEIEDCVGTWDIEELKEMKRECVSLDTLIDDKKKEENPYTDQVNELPPLTSIDEYDEALEDIIKKEKHCSYLVKLLTDPKSFIRKNIVDQYVPFLNKKINEYTKFLDLPHVSEINADMTVDIEYMGKSVSYFTLSRGERLRVDVATAMAFRDLLRTMGTGINLLLVDEVLDSALDAHGTRKTFDFIRQFASNTLLISHREEFHTMVDKVVTINKRNGFSIIDDE